VKVWALLMLVFNTDPSVSVATLTANMAGLMIRSATWLALEIQTKTVEHLG